MLQERFTVGSNFAVIAVIAALGCMGCEAVLGAEFADFDRPIEDAAANDIASDNDGPWATDGRRGTVPPSLDANGATGMDANTGRDVASPADRSADTGGTTGSGGSSGSGGTTSGPGGAGGGGTTGSGGGGVGGTTGTGGTGGAAGNGSAGASGAGSGPVADGGERDVSYDVGDVSVDANARDASTEKPDGGADASLDAPPRDDGPVIGTCVPGQISAIGPCGNCGLYLQRCNARGAWDPPFCQQDSAACVPGTVEARSCQGNGTQVATCTASCTWSLGECVRPECKPGQTETKACPMCGAQTRTCEATGGGQWGPFSACTGQGVCASGTKDEGSCGRCGTHARVCSAMCTWGVWSLCLGEGPCTPGQVQTEACLLFTKRSRTCGTTCQWGDWGKCE